MLKEYDNKIQELNQKLGANESLDDVVNEARHFINKVSHYQFDVQSELIEMDDCIYIPNDLAKHLYVD